MFRLFDPNKCEPPKPWLVRVLEGNDSPKWLGCTRNQWLLNAALWLVFAAVASASYLVIR